jgi:hypothetical protein
MGKHLGRVGHSEKHVLDLAFPLTVCVCVWTISFISLDASFSTKG